MPTLDSCIANLYEPGNIGADAGSTVVPSLPPLTPTITSASAVDVDEDATLAHTLTASSFVVWSIVGGADQAQFEISGSILRWASDGTQDFEAPADADTDNVYEVTVRAVTRWLSTADQNISVTVNDVIALLNRQSMVAGSLTPVFVVSVTSARQAVATGPVAVNET